MKRKINKNFWMIMAIFLVSAVISWSLYFKNYVQSDTVHIQEFPAEFDGWKSEDLPLTEVEYAILETKNVFVRRYFKPEHQDIYLFIVYSQNNRKVSHPPEVCYTGAGISVLTSSHDVIPAISGKEDIKINKLNLASKGLNQVAFYWFKVGDTFTPNYWKQQMLIAVKTILGKPSSSALIRISTDNKESQSASTKELKEFGTVITPLLYQFLP